MIKLLLLMLSVLCITGNNPADVSYDDFPQSGVLAANGNLPSGNLALPQLPMGLMGQQVPLLASLSQSSDGKWNFGVQNNTDRAIKVSIEVIQYDGNRNKLSTSKYQYKLKAGKSEERSAAVLPAAAGCVVFLKSWAWLDK